MARIETWFTQDLNAPVKIRYLDGNVFSSDNQGNIIGVNVFDGDTPATLSGTVSASIIRSDGATVSATGTLYGNKCSVILPANAYGVPGVISIVIKLTSGTDITTLCAVVANVYQTSTDTAVDPGTIIPSITALIQAINDAIASIPADYSDLWTSLAPAFSSTSTYSSGQYVTYNGGLWRFNSAHTGDWSYAHVLPATLGNGISDLRSTIYNITEAYGYNLFNPLAYIPNVFLDGSTGEASTFTTYWASGFISINSSKPTGLKLFKTTGNVSGRIYFYDSNRNFISRSTGNPVIATTPSNAAYVRICQESNSNTNGTVDPFGVVLTQSETTSIDSFVAYSYAIDMLARTKGVRMTSLPSGVTDMNNLEDNTIVYASTNSVPSHFPNTIFTVGYFMTVALNATNRVQIGVDAYGELMAMRSEVNGTWGAWSRVITDSSAGSIAESSSVALFETVGCCGDSFSSGYLYNKTDSPFYDPTYVPNGEYPKISYPTIMGRIYGCDVSTYATSGVTTGTWMTTSSCLPALLADDPKQLYIIALGLNDKTQEIPAGVEADLDTPPATATALGNWGQIIRAITTHAPNSKIILVKSMWVCNEGYTSPNTYYNYLSPIIETVSSHFGIPFIETNHDGFFCSYAYINGLKGQHPTAPLYAGMGKRIGELVGRCVIENPAYFYNFYIPN